MARLSETWPFVGREEEMAFLRRALDEVRDGRTVALMVGGESGVGKSRLVGELAARVAGDATVLAGAALDIGETPPFWPVTDPLRRLLRGPGGAWARDALAPWAAELDTVLPGPAVPADRPVRSTLELLSQTVAALAAPAPLVLVVEDLHWADRSTRDLLVYLLANLSDQRVLLLCTYRSDALGRSHPLRPFLPELGRDRRVRFLDLEPLDEPAVAELVRATLGPSPAPAVLDAVWARSEGNPFVVEETLRALDSGEGLRLPTSLRQLVLGRIDTLPEPSDRVLRAMAAGDGTVEHPLLAAVAGVGEQDLLRAVRATVEAGVLRVDGGGEGYQFRHRLYREVLDGELLPGERAALHRRYAEALDPERVVGGGAPGLLDARLATRLAYHWDGAADAERAAAAAVHAALSVERIYAFAEAHRHWERALELVEQPVPAPAGPALDRHQLLERAASAAHLAGEHQRAVALWEARLAGAPADGAGAAGPLEESLLHQHLGRALMSAGLGTRAVAAHRRAVELLPAAGAEPERAAVIGAHAEALLHTGAYRESRAQAERALGLARAAGSLTVEAAVLATLGFSLAYLEDPDAGVAAAEEGCRIAELAASPDAVGRSYVNLAELLAGPLNRMREAVNVARRGWERARALGVSRTHGVVLLSVAANALFRSGDWDEAADNIAEALAEHPTGAEAIEVRLARARLLVAWGEFDEAEEDLGAVDVLCAESVGPRYRVPLLTLRAGMAMWRGRPDLARRAVARGLEAALATSDDVFVLAPIVWHGLHAEADLAEAALVVTPESTATLDGLLARMRELVERAESAAPAVRDWVLGYLELGEAEASRAAGHSDPDLWGRAAGRWERRHHPYPAAYARMRQAEAMFGRRAGRVGAPDILRGALGTARRMGARPMIAEMEALAARARVDLGGLDDPRRDDPRRHDLRRHDPHGDGGGPPGAGDPAGPAGEATRERPVPEGAVGGGDAAGGVAALLATLTPREAAVLEEIAEGRTNREIAARLFISEKTVSVHVSHILAKLGLRTRVQAGTLLLRARQAMTPS